MCRFREPVVGENRLARAESPSLPSRKPPKYRKV